MGLRCKNKRNNMKVQFLEWPYLEKMGFKLKSTLENIKLKAHSIRSKDFFEWKSGSISEVILSNVMK